MTAIDYSALIERLTRKNEDGTLCEITEADQQASADALERLTQPVGVEPVARFNISPNSGASSSSGGQWVLHEHHAETVARLIAERDAFKRALDDLGVTPEEAKAGAARSIAIHKERDALQEQVKTLRDALKHLEHNARKSGANMGLALDVARELLAATEPDGDALLFAAEAKQCNHDCNQGRNCTCGGGK